MESSCPPKRFILLFIAMDISFSYVQPKLYTLTRTIPHMIPVRRPVKWPIESIFFEVVIIASKTIVGIIPLNPEEPLTEYAITIYIPRSPQITPDAPIDIVNGDDFLWILADKVPPHIMITM